MVLRVGLLDYKVLRVVIVHRDYVQLPVQEVTTEQGGGRLP